MAFRAVRPRRSRSVVQVRTIITNELVPSRTRYRHLALKSDSKANYDRGMDEDIKPLLSDIASELRARNDLIRRQQEEAEKLRSSMFSGMSFDAGEKVKETMERSRSESQAVMKGLRNDAERDRAERHEFQQALLEEIRRLNSNLEQLARSASADKPA
jgi:hypothetical protein